MTRIVTSASSCRPSTLYDTTLRMLSSSPHTSAEDTARRARSGSVTVSSGWRVGQHVTHAAYRVYQLHAVAAVDLVAQGIDMHLDDVADAVEVDVPYVFDDKRTRQWAVGVAHQELEQRVLFWLELDKGAGAADQAADGVHFQVGDAQHALARSPAPEQRSQSCRQLGQGERLGHIVVGAGIEPGNTLIQRVLGGENQDWQLRLSRTDIPQHLKARTSGQHEIEHDRVVIDGPGLLAGTAALVQHIDGVSLLLQAGLYEARHLPVVLDHHDAHATLLRLSL